MSKKQKIIFITIICILFLGSFTFGYLYLTGKLNLKAFNPLKGGSSGASISKGATTPSKTWYFAEGTTRSNPEFDTLLLLQNPASASVKVTVTYALESGQGKTKDYILSPASRFTINVNSEVGQGKDVAMKVTANTPIVAERSMYFIYNKKYGSSSSVGSPSLYNWWYFPEGCTGPGYDQYMLVYNPNSKSTKVNFIFRNQAGATVGKKTITVAAGRRSTLKANDVAGSQWEVWTFVTSDLPIMAERSIYVHQGDKSGGTNAIGLKAQPGNNWYFAESYVTSSGSFQEYISVIDPRCDGTQTNVQIIGYSGGKTIAGPTYKIPVCGRVTIPVHTLNQFKDKADLSIRIKSDKPVMAERSMYINNNFGNGVYVWDGTCETGVRAEDLATTWYLPEGYTDNNFLEYLIILNPENSTNNILIQFQLNDGEIQEKTLTLKPQKRTTIKVNDIIKGGHSIQIHSSKPVTAERAIYFNTFKPPSISSLSPTSGFSGTKTNISGDNFIGIENVLLDNVPVQYNLVNSNLIQTAIYGSKGLHTIKIKNQRGTSNSVNFSIEGSGSGNVPLLKQCNPEWGYISYGCGGTTICSAGCGPTSLAMVLNYYGKNTSPAITADQCLRNGWRICNGGTATDAMIYLPQLYGLKSTEVNWSQAKSGLLKGNPVIVNWGGPSRFTSFGHYCVLTTYDTTNNIAYMNDPGGRNQTSAYESELTSPICKHLWLIEP